MVEAVDVELSKKSPLRTALGPPSLVIRSCTWPERFQATYAPLWNDEIVRVSRTVPVPASTTSIRSERLVVSQSRKYALKRCVIPSLRLISTVKELAEYQVAAMRSEAAAFCSARVSVVL